MSLQEFILHIFSEEVITGVITGLIVGLILWAFEVRRDNQLVKHRYEREISILREKLYFVNYHAAAFQLDSVVESQPIFVEEIIDIIQESPLDLMERYSRHNKDLAAFLHQLKNNYLEVRREAEELDILMTDYIRHYNAKLQVARIHDAKYKTFFIGKIYDWEEAEIQIFIGNAVIEDEMREQYDHFEEKHRDLITSYLKTRKEMIQHAKKLKEKVMK